MGTDPLGQSAADMVLEGRQPDGGALEVWQKSCSYLYLPRLRDADVIRQTLAAGAGSRDFFGFAYGRDGDRYLGFHFGKATSPILDDSLVLVEPKEAERFDAILAAEEAARRAATTPTEGTGVPAPTPQPGSTQPPTGRDPLRPRPLKNCFLDQWS